MADKLNFNKELMEEISGKYQSCTTEAETILTNLKKLKDQLNDNYEGHGSPLSDDAVSKIIEHVEFLKKCYSSTEQFVTQTQTTMATLDSALMKPSDLIGSTASSGGGK
ncbi:WXG100 family type VII secretion target [Enterococcus sp. BWR-S5]|uniref:WXG100 family type VII secretion target n=1 Tax=Enterococcus sp. BWR-S5 TaxID=2787714 RepID=UPI0019248E54|nr:WXG100 family type VII secretion target [Enterococcus sp. BWR-S5]MBL1223664.1 WXG100 family type VII secretion target [Enterococcus sp. BWR-S5]